MTYTTEQIKEMLEIWDGRILEFPTEIVRQLLEKIEELEKQLNLC